MELHRAEKDAEILRKIDAALCEETTLLDGLTWATEHNFMSQEEADQCYADFIAKTHPESPEAA